MNKLVLLFFVFSLFFRVFSQESLQESLKEEEEFYNNFGLNGYSKREIEQQKIPYYDNFGNHVTNGFLIYGLESQRSKIFDSDGGRKFSEYGEVKDDSTVNAYNNMFQTSLMSENFNNLILAKDALGEMKSTFLIGTQIQTRLSPLTMNKLNFQGVRWDIWTSNMKFTSLVSRTRPFIISQNDISGRSYIGYDRNDMRNWQGTRQDELLPDEEYIEQNWGDNAGAPGRWSGWTLNYDKWNDYSNKSIYGDYDILWGFHGKTNLANKVDVGVTYLNHHRSDIEKGEKIFSGDVPDEYVPTEIHFEFYDLTPSLATDPGVRVADVRMKMNGVEIDNASIRDVYLVRDNLQLVSSVLPNQAEGTDKPVIVAFRTSLAAKRYFGDSTKVNRIDFSFSVAGNYLVFVSTDKLVSMGFSAQRNSTTNQVEIDGPFTRSLKEMYDVGSAFSPVEILSGGAGAQPTTGPNLGRNYKVWGNSYFGDYIAKSPQIIYSAAGVADKSAAYASSERSYTYTYSINSGSSTYGIDFKGKIAGINLDGEIAVNKKDYLYPGGDKFDPVYRTGAYLRLNRDIIKNLLIASGMVYNVDAEYDPALEVPMVSQHFSYSRLYTKLNPLEEFSIPDYLYYPQHFDNNFRLLDDNDDQDLYVESDHIVYPSDLGSGNALNRWQADGTFNSYKAASRDNRRLHRKANYIYFPNGLYRWYGDDDGAFVNRFDRNRNGRVDYSEDFLLYQVDPPIFELDVDVDNNGVWDVEDDDPFPDLPEGIKVSHVLVSNGWKSQGIRGLNGQLKYKPTKTLEFTTKGIYEKALDLDFNANSDATDNPSLIGNGALSYKTGSKAETFSDSRSFVFKGSALLDVVKRNQGLAYFLGAEAQYLRDNIRNDVIRLQEVEDPEFTFEDFYYQTDELRYRNAGVANAIAGITYNNIPNFIYTAKASLGLESRFDLGNELFYTVKTLRNPAQDTTLYAFTYEQYKPSQGRRLFLVDKFDYTFRFDMDYKDWRRHLSFLNRLSINPQYKLTWSYWSSNAADDPRETLDRSQVTTADDSTQQRLDWARYRQENLNEFMSVPILRFAYKIAERTQLQYGFQWKKTFDQVVRSESAARRVQTLQVQSSDNVAGYNVALIIGMNLLRNDYDVLQYDPLYQTGHLYDGKDAQYFIKVYAGN